MRRSSFLDAEPRPVGPRAGLPILLEEVGVRFLLILRHQGCAPALPLYSLDDDLSAIARLAESIRDHGANGFSIAGRCHRDH
jgi:hypothetical protein